MLVVLILYKWLLFSFTATLLTGKAGNDFYLKEKKHPFYISVTEINHNGKDKTLEISCKIFADDMEATLKQNYKTAVDLTSEKQQALANNFIKEYISRHLKLSAEDKALLLNYVGFEKESEAVYCYFEVSNISAVKNLKIENTILHDFTPQQINIMHVTVNGKRQSIKLDAGQKEARFVF